MTTDEHAEQLVPLSILSLEVLESADELALQLAADLIIGDELGRRCVAASVARRLIEAEAQRRHAAAEADRRREAARRERQRERERKRQPVPRGVRLDVPPGMSAASVMGAQDGPAVYEGGTYRPVPSSADWHFNNAEGGASLGPTPNEMRAAARQNATSRKAKKKGRAT